MDESNASRLVRQLEQINANLALMNRLLEQNGVFLMNLVEAAGQTPTMLTYTESELG